MSSPRQGCDEANDRASSGNLDRSRGRCLGGTGTAGRSGGLTGELRGTDATAPDRCGLALRPPLLSGTSMGKRQHRRPDTDTSANTGSPLDHPVLAPVDQPLQPASAIQAPVKRSCGLTRPWPVEVDIADLRVPVERWYAPDGEPSGRPISALYDLQDLRRIVHALELMLGTYPDAGPREVPHDRPLVNDRQVDPTPGGAHGDENGREDGGPSP